MADVRIPSSLPSARTPGVAPARSTEAVRAAQRAFFNTALANADAPAAARPAAPAATAVTAQAVSATPLRPQTTETQASPTRLLRPGSLLDIRI